MILSIFEKESETTGPWLLRGRKASLTALNLDRDLLGETALVVEVDDDAVRPRVSRLENATVSAAAGAIDPFVPVVQLDRDVALRGTAVLLGDLLDPRAGVLAVAGAGRLRGGLGERDALPLRLGRFRRGQPVGHHAQHAVQPEISKNIGSADSLCNTCGGLLYAVYSLKLSLYKFIYNIQNGHF